MGNAASNASGQRPPAPQPSPTPGNPHPSLRTKKKSLELPDLADLALSARTRPPPKSASIPIPGPPRPPATDPRAPRAPIALPSTTDVPLLDPRQFPPPSRAERRIQALYDQSHQSPAPVPPPPFVPETVTSVLPIGLSHVPQTPHPALVPVPITWHGGGKSVYLARAADDDWKGRLPMVPESPNSAVYHATVRLPPGTHHFRFLIDDSWRVADDLPTAVDDQGSLANYVAVPLPDSSPPQTQSKPRPGHSFWNAPDDDDHSSAPAPAPALSPHARWSSVLPLELIEAAREEEAYLAASEGHASYGTQRVAGFVPAPNIPPAPGLPRHLDKLILNNRPVVQGGAVVGSGAVPPRKGTPAASRKTRDREGRDRDRRDGWRDRDRDRDRDRRERRNPPPPPPPSEVDVDPEPILVPRSPPHDIASTPIPSPSPASPSSAPTSRPLTISLDTDESAVPLTDDASVLPVPSHVVLHHLSTSAIRNGVLAVGTTTRYRKKYLTTIYYKPS